MSHREVVVGSPSGFCAGVEAAVKSLAWLIALNPPPVACVHAIVHNEDVVERFERLGVQFVDRAEDAPPGAAVLLSAHGSGPTAGVRADQARLVVDAACPLVTKVHREIRDRSRAGNTILYVGHPGHDETEGAVAHSQVPVHVIERADDLDALHLDRDRPIALLAQTTVAFSEWEEIGRRVRDGFLSTWTPPRHDICFATTNRQLAVRALAAECDAVVVVGSRRSSNTAALVATARAAGAREVQRVRGDWDLSVPTSDRVGVIAGASTPSAAVKAVVDALRPCTVRTLRADVETQYFPLAAGVRRQVAAAVRVGALPPALQTAFRDDRHVTSDALLAIVERVVRAQRREPAVVR